MFYKTHSLWHHLLDENEVKTHIKCADIINFAHRSNAFSLPFFAISYNIASLFVENNRPFCILNNTKMYEYLSLICGKYAAKPTAICTKTRCILHQNALRLAPKRNSICCKLPYFGVDLWSISEIKWFRMYIWRQIATKKWEIAWWFFGWRLNRINILLADH